MYVYTDYGAAAHHKVVFDGQDWRISSVAADTPGPGKTTITIGGTTGLSTDLLNGCELVISRPTSSGDRYITARVDDTTSTTIVVTDAGSTSAPVYLALNGQTQGFVVYDFHTGDNTTGGTWTEGPGYNSMLGLTRFTDSTASFAAFMVGWTVILDAEKPSFLTIFGVPPDGLSVEVRGDASGLAASGSDIPRDRTPGRGFKNRRPGQTRKHAQQSGRQPRLRLPVEWLPVHATPGRPRKRRINHRRPGRHQQARQLPLLEPRL
ncbi:MAG: hypothetical protein IPP14_16185 [Planctomycetes bacterium]|nr:hypothetical protein [Planctomycetota bacterium]